MRPFAGLFASLVLAAGGAAAASPPSAPMQAEAPRSVEAIPLFPGLRLEREEVIPPDQGTLYIPGDWEGETYPRVSGKTRHYVSTAPAEEVYAFYLQRLGGTIEASDADTGPHEIGPGGVTTMDRSQHAHLLHPTADARNNRPISPEMQRQLLASHRPSAEYGWLRDGSFAWIIKDRAGLMTSFSVQIADESVAPNWDGYEARTEVEISVETFGPLEGGD